MKPTQIATELVNEMQILDSIESNNLVRAKVRAKAFAQAWSQEVEFLRDIKELFSENHSEDGGEYCRGYFRASENFFEEINPRIQELQSALQILKDGGASQ